MNRGRTLWSLGGTLLVAGAFGIGTWFGEQRVHARGEWADARLLSTAIDSVRVNALDSLPSDELIRRAVAGMLRELQDPYAAIMRPDGYQRYRGSLQGDAQGLGLTLRRQGSNVTVSRVAAGSPAAVAGTRAGDRVLMVNDVPIAQGWGRTEADTSTAPLELANLVLWRAPDGDTVRVSVRPGAWHARAVSDAAMLTDSVAYVRLSSITAQTSSELEHAVDSLQAHGAESLILDLRGNAGGLFEEGVRAAGLFLKRGLVVASLDGRRGSAPEPHYAKKSRWTTMPITVLVDAGTASAAEVIAAALRDHRRALIVGTPTYGKGVVQRVVKLTPELSMRLTTARWLTPNGVSLERRHGVGRDAKGGMIPDVLLDDAVRRDAFALPRDWSGDAVAAVSSAADSASVHALREGWTTLALPSLESRLQERILTAIPRTLRGDAMRAAWLNVGTRLATVRALEAAGELDALLRYSVREDGALRAGLDVLEPGSNLVRVTPSSVPDAVTARRTSPR
ncbi:MAG TPA: S41 family peptidase [Gemmatimonas sp.]|nr:S41 family peptidase [Gemmatimonas sp.]